MHFSIDLKTTCYCPCCLAPLTNKNIAFFGRFAFCSTCTEHPFVNDPEAAIWAMINVLHHRHLVSYRNLIFFVPQIKPPVSVQLLPFENDPYWKEKPDQPTESVREPLSRFKRRLFNLQLGEH
jgi:hypothetical protein